MSKGYASLETGEESPLVGGAKPEGKFFGISYKKTAVVLSGVCTVLLIAVVALAASRGSSHAATVVPMESGAMGRGNFEHSQVGRPTQGPFSVPIPEHRAVPELFSETGVPPARTFVWDITRTPGGTLQVNEIGLYDTNGNRVWPAGSGLKSVTASNGNMPATAIYDGITWNKFTADVPCTLTIEFTYPKALSGFDFVYGNDASKVPQDWTMSTLLEDGTKTLIQTVTDFTPPVGSSPKLSQIPIGFAVPAAVYGGEVPVPESPPAPPPSPEGFGTSIMWVITGARSSTTMIQVSELEFWEGDQYNGGILIPMSCTAPDASSPSGEQIQYLTDRNGNTKFLDFNFAANGGTTIYCELDYAPSHALGSYKWMTGNDATERDPFVWTMYVEYDGVMVDISSIGSGELVPDSRNAWTEPGYKIFYPFPPPPTAPNPPPPPPSGVTCDTFMLQSVYDTSYCVHPNGGEYSSNGVDMVFWNDCSQQTRLQFHPVWFDDSNMALQSAQYPQRCMHPDGGHANANGVDEHAWDGCDAGPRIMVKAVPQGNGAFVLQSTEYPNMCLHPDGGYPGQGTVIHWWDDCNAGSRIQFNQLCA